MPTPIIPEYITVHLGPPRSDAPNVTVSFPDYIKNVASSEIYPTWPESAIRANIYAQISFALNRVYLEYYRSRGYDFDITNYTGNDQAFVYGRDVFENISQIVDEIFNDYVVRQGSVEPLFTEYCDGDRVSCNGLSQWGTVSLANQGYTPYQILQYYYGDDINIVRNAPVEGVSASVPLGILRLGSTGDDVRQVQLRLNRISNNFPAISKIYPVNGIFDEGTRDAVIEFQRTFSLAPDGLVGKDTWYQIQLIYNSVKRLSELDSEGLTLNEISLQYPGVLTVGDVGVGVRTVQYFLDYISRYEAAVPGVTIDGDFGEGTRSAVVAFQQTYGLEPDGVVGERTYYKLYDVYRGIINSQSPNVSAGNVLPYPGYVLTTGQQSEYVRALQTYLNFISESYLGIPSVPVTGVFAELTREAVEAFQRYFGIGDPATYGTVGFDTWRAVTDLYLELYSSQRVATGQYPGYEIS